jgi:hypothetical protein
MLIEPLLESNNSKALLFEYTDILERVISEVQDNDDGIEGGEITK